MDLNCPACGREGPTQSEGGVVRCATCGLALTRAVLGKVAVKRVKADELAEPPVVVGAVMEEGAEVELIRPGAPETLHPPRGGLFRCAVLAEDLELHRTVIRDGLLQYKLADQVVLTSRGDEFLTSVTQAFVVGAGVDLCILDLEMPGLDGRSAAVALRAVEQAFGRAPAPILFFSARPCDEALKAQLEQLAPASYLNKAVSTNVAELFARLAAVLRPFRGEPALSE